MPEQPLDSPRLWVDIPDPHTPVGAAPEQVFHVDVTWLTSSWTCIFGRGCPGIYANRPTDGCCTLGAHFSERDDEKRVRKAVRRLDESLWQRVDKSVKKGWVEVEDGARKTRVVNGACIFLNDPDFPGGSGCALHHLAARENVPVTATKPDVCWQLPIRRTYRTVERPDSTSYLEVSIAEYDRRGWGEGGHDLDWYCTGNPVAHVGQQPVYIALAAELIELIGQAPYDAVAEVCAQALAARPMLTVVRHPADPDAS